MILNDNLLEFKKEFSDREGIQFNNAGMSPLSRSVAFKVTSLVSQNQFLGSLVDSEWLPKIKETRESLANFIGAEVDQIAFTQNCAIALSQAALGFKLVAGDEVITCDQEYASNYYPWKVACERSGAKFTAIASGAEFNQGDVLTQKIIEAIKPGVKIVALSWVQFQTGAILNLRAIGERAHAVGAFFVVDGIQGIGQLPFSFRDLPIDFLVGGSHKWMCSLNGQGFLAVKKEFLNLLSPTNIGCGTYGRFGTFADPKALMESSARKFEPGGFGFLPMFALQEALLVHSRAGIETIAAEIFRLSQILRAGLSEQKITVVTPTAQKGGVTSFQLPMDREAKLLVRCREERIAIVKRADFIRLSIHAYANESEIERFLQLLASC